MKLLKKIVVCVLCFGAFCICAYMLLRDSINFKIAIDGFTNRFGETENVLQNWSLAAATEFNRTGYAPPPLSHGYNRGKEIRYAPITGCTRPSLLPGYAGNLCWNLNNTANGIVEVTCAPRLVIIGIHKCGTTDLLRAVADTSLASFWITLYGDSKLLLKTCPGDIYSATQSRERNRVRNEAFHNKLVSVSCDDCFRGMEVVAEEESHYLIRSAIQVLNFYGTDQIRYILTLRNPTDRMFSHYFYFLRINRFKGLPAFRSRDTAESIGFDFLHSLLLESIVAMQNCVEKNGASGCILLTRHLHESPMPILTKMIQISCYVVYVEEILKFIPREQLHVIMLEEYGKDKIGSLKTIYKFIGHHSSRFANNGTSAKVANRVMNKGLSKIPVHQKSIDLLDRFYQPFNDELAKLLGDGKWLFRRDQHP